MAAPNRREAERREADSVSAADWINEKTAKWKPTTYKLPEGTEQYKVEEGAHGLDIIPYRIGKGKPAKKCRRDPGLPWFECEYIVHPIPAANGKSDYYCCLWETFGEKCPICDWCNTSGRNFPKEMTDALRGRTRNLYNVNDKPGNLTNPLKVMDMIFFNRKLGFGQQLTNTAKLVPEYASFADLRTGYTIKFTIESKYKNTTSMAFIPRKYQYPPTMLDRACVLDECLVKYPYEELREILHQGLPDSNSSGPSGYTQDAPPNGEHHTDPEPPPPVDNDGYDDGATTGPVTAEDLGIAKGSEVIHDTMGLITVLGVSKDRLKLKVRDAQGTTHEGILCASVSVMGAASPEPEPEEPAAAGPPWAKGDECEFDYQGATLTGTIMDINPVKGLARIQVPEQERPSVVSLDELRPVTVPEPAAAPDDTGWDSGGAGAWDSEPTNGTAASADGETGSDGWDSEPTTENSEAATGWDDEPAEPTPAPATKKPASKKPAAAPPTKKPAGKPAAAGKKPAAKKTAPAADGW